jgi:[ribosomal protein S18]-alanine N-acetyltransferase
VTLTLTRMRWWHIDALLGIEEDLFGAERWSAGMFWNELANGHHYVIAEEDGEILGYAGLAAQGDETWVQNIAVRRDAQRRGIGSALLGDLLAEADRAGARTVLLEVAVDNKPAQKLYAMHGFEPVGVRRGYYQPSNTDALVMCLDR